MIDPSHSASDAFLSGQGVPVAPGRWRPSWQDSGARRPSGCGGPDLENPNVTRVSLANLVVACLVEGVPRERVGARHGRRPTALPGHRLAGQRRPAAAGLGRGLGFLPPARARLAAGL